MATKLGKTLPRDAATPVGASVLDKLTADAVVACLAESFVINAVTADREVEEELVLDIDEGTAPGIGVGTDT